MRPSGAAASASCTAASDSRVEVGGRLVEDDDPRLGQQEAGDRQALALASGQAVAARRRRCRDHPATNARAAPAGLFERRPQVVVTGVGCGVQQVGRIVSWNRWPSWVATPTAIADRLEGQVAHVDARATAPGRRRRAAGRARRVDFGRTSRQRPRSGLGGPGRDAVQHLDARSVVEHGDLLREASDTCSAVGYEKWTSSNRPHRTVRDRCGRSVSWISSSTSSTSNTRSKLTSAADDVEPGVASVSQRCVEAVEQQRQRDDGARVGLALDGEGSRRVRRSGPGRDRTPGRRRTKTPSPSPTGPRCH